VATDINALRSVWNRFGEIDPLWAVLSDDAKKGGRWDVEQFFESGRVEVDDVIRRVDAALAATGREVRPRAGALDFGCGVGRISQGLSPHVGQVDGVDIAVSMVRRAEELNRADNVRFHVSSGELLEQFPDGTFDLVYTAHVLQHMDPVYQRQYVTEFFRVLRPEGVAMLEFATDPVRGAAEALPDAAFRAELTVVAAPSRLNPGDRSTVRVRVRNASGVTWPSTGTDGWYLVTLGGHWWPVDAESGDRTSSESQEEPHRAWLPADLPAGEEVELELPVEVPAEPGAYRLALDLVQEGVDWFVTRGSTPAETAVIRVGGPSGWRHRLSAVGSRALHRSGPSAATEAEPVMEMHGVDDKTIRGWVAQSGGRVLASFDWDEVSKSRSRDWQRRGYICVCEQAGS
jgi:SAM-dependent methyltransferase